MSRIKHIVTAALCLTLFCSCSGGGRIIPKGKMAHIYADMFMSDQWLLQHQGELGLMADTTLVYEPIFRKYGYTSDDYRASMEHYLLDTDRYARILKNTVSILEARVKELKKIQEVENALQEAIAKRSIYAPKKLYFLSGMHNPEVFSYGDTLKFYVDTTGETWAFDPQKGLDTMYYGPRMRLRQLL